LYAVQAPTPLWSKTLFLALSATLASNPRMSRAMPFLPPACRKPCRAPQSTGYGSGQQALHFAAQAVMSGTMDIVIAGGVESMTLVPMGTMGEGGGMANFTIVERL
jgi:hypothetical protein